MRYMDKYHRLSSVEFRKTYPRLEEATLVTAGGRVIGLYVPYTLTTRAEAAAAIEASERPYQVGDRLPPAPLGLPGSIRNEIADAREFRSDDLFAASDALKASAH